MAGCASIAGSSREGDRTPSDIPTHGPCRACAHRAGGWGLISAKAVARLVAGDIVFSLKRGMVTNRFGKRRLEVEEALVECRGILAI